MIKTIAAAMAAAFVSVAGLTAHASDLYAPASFKDVPVVVPAPIWTGFYGGVHLGAAWTDIGVQRNIFYDGYGAGVPVNDMISATGFGGGQLGYNWQLPASNFILGIEVDLDGIGGNNERGGTAVTYDGQVIRNVRGVKMTENGGFAGDFTGRLGYTWSNWMLYAKGGFAWFNPTLQATTTIWDHKGTAIQSANNNGGLTGFTVGGGIEWMLNPSWSIKAEYLYYDFDVKDSNWNINTSVRNSAFDNNGRWFSNDMAVNTVKFGLNYHLTSCYTALK
jgi:opacity protein-like surface antigen